MIVEEEEEEEAEEEEVIATASDRALPDAPSLPESPSIILTFR